MLALVGKGSAKIGVIVGDGTTTTKFESQIQFKFSDGKESCWHIVILAL